MFSKLLRVSIGPRKVFIRMPLGGAIYDLDTGALYYLNEDGARIFEAVCGDFFKSLDILCKNEDRRECIQRIVEFLREASARGHVVVYSPFSIKKPREVGKCTYSSWFIPSLIDVEVTSRCNARCPYCYLERKDNDLDPNSFEKFLDKLTSIDEYRVKIPFILLSGGEPLIHPKFNDFLEIALQYSLKVGILTNGIELDRFIDEIIKNKDRILVQVSIDSTNKELYSVLKGVDPKFLGRVLDSISKLIEEKVPVYIAVPVSKVNLEDIPNTVQYLKKLYGDTVKLRIAPVISVGGADDQYSIGPGDISIISRISGYTRKFGDPIEVEAAKKLLEESPIPNCGAGWLRIYVDSEGYIKPCPIMPNTQRFGRIDDDLQDLLGRGKALSFAKITAPNAEGICKGCPYASWCHRCIARALWLSMKGVKCRWLILEGHKIGQYSG